MAVALTGCVIVSQTSKDMKFKKKCESCGWVDTSTIGGLLTRPGSKRTGSFQCPKCKKQNKYIIQS